jgi:hypothetical protein
VEVDDGAEATIADEPLPADELQPEPAVHAEAFDQPAAQTPLDSGVTPSADWDEDAASYSAPI